MDAADRALLQETVRDAITNAYEASNGKAGVDDVLTELGWLEMLDAEPRDAVPIVFEALGATGATASVLDDVLAVALGVAPRDDLAVVLPRFGAWDAPGRAADAAVEATGLGTARVATAVELLVVCADGEAQHAVTVPVAYADVTPVHGVDPDGGFHTVRLRHDAAAPLPLDAPAWERAVAAGRRAVGHQIVGANRSMLDMARRHAVERAQFGRPIARFQAVRHRLAEALVAIEALEAALGAAWDEGGPLTAALASAVAGRTARTVAAQCQQVLAGIGFTTDHAFHRYLKRTMALEGLFGATDDIVLDIGRQLLATRTVPTLIEL